MEGLRVPELSLNLNVCLKSMSNYLVFSCTFCCYVNGNLMVAVGHLCWFYVGCLNHPKDSISVKCSVRERSILPASDLGNCEFWLHVRRL